MNACCGSRSARPAGLFSFGLLDGPQVRLRRPHVREGHGKGRVLARLGWAGEMAGFGLSKTRPPHHSAASANVTRVIPRAADLATTFMNIPG
ncbi:MAG: hypothetical protein ABI945_09240 [Nitrospirales bacterium]